MFEIKEKNDTLLIKGIIENISDEQRLFNKLSEFGQIIHQNEWYYFLSDLTGNLYALNSYDNSKNIFKVLRKCSIFKTNRYNNYKKSQVLDTTPMNWVK